MEPKLKKKSLFKRIIRNQLIVTVITGIFLLMMIIGSSYAVFNQKVFNTENDVVVQSGNLEVVISNQSDMIEMNYTTLGVPDEVGLTYDPYTFTVENTGNANIAYYEIRIVDKEYEISTLPHKSLNFSIAVNNGNYQTPQNLGDNDSYIYVGSDLKVGETDSFNLKLWVNEEWGKYANNKTLKASIEVTLYSEDPIRNYIVYDCQGGSFVPKTSIFSKRVTRRVPSKLGYEFLGWSTSSNGSVEYESNDIYQSDVGIVLYAIYEGLINYDLNGGVGEISSNRINEGIASEVPSRGGYKFLGWAIASDATTPDYIAGDVYDGNAITLYAVWQEIEYLYNTVETSLTSYLTAADSDGTRFVIGNSVNNNYVWYSGKLWRIVSINSDGTIKLITQNPVTTIKWSVDDSTDYSMSQIRTWLQEEFLPTLHNSDDLIVESEWDYTTNSSISTTKKVATNTVLDKVGLLNSYEYAKAGGRSDKTANTYLNNGYYWWLLTPHTDDTYIWHVLDYAVTLRIYIAMAPTYGYPTGGHGVRPVINLASDVMLSKGSGSKGNPYIIEGDKNLVENQKLNERISGEYVSFNNTIYRIIDTENVNGEVLTKVVMADYDSNQNTLLTAEQFGINNQGNFTVTEGVGKYLYDWYNGTEINLSYKEMIATNGIKWYIGPDGGVTDDYTLSKTGNIVETPVGLSYYGEKFSSQFGDGVDTSVDIWLITKFSKGLAWKITNEGYSDLQQITYNQGVRPVFYLKSNVQIGDANGDGNVGTGLPNDPYEIVCAACS